MITDRPTMEQLRAALAMNGRQEGMCKHVLDEGWWFIDESAPTRKRIPEIEPDTSVEAATCEARADAEMMARLLDTARRDGWRITDDTDPPRVDLGGKRRAKAGLFFVAGRGPSLCVEALRQSADLSEGAAAFVLRLTAFLRRVRASLIDFGRGPQLVWEAPIDPADDSEEQWIEALCCLADAVRHGQAEAELLGTDEATAARWLEMNFPPKHD